MNKTYALIFAIIITVLIAINVSLFTGNVVKETKSVKIIRIIDGDTLEIEDKTKIRLLNINAPEKNTPHYKEARDYLSLYLNKTIDLEITTTDKYGRTLARIYAPEYLNLELVKRGLASKFLVDETEIKLFSEAEESAINSEKGIWKKSAYFNCLETFIDEIKEEVIITNNCNKLNISSWAIKDESRQLYRFKESSLTKIKLHSSIGKDNETDIFWNSKTNIWNNDRDTLYIFDKDSNIVYFYSYGY